MYWKPEISQFEAQIFAHSHKHDRIKSQRWIAMLSCESQNLDIKVFCTILEEIPLYFPGLQMSGTDQSKRIVDQ